MGGASKGLQLPLRHIPSSSLHVSTPTWWLESRFHFSFAEYYNPSNQEFGVLRVLNDDLVKPNSGFTTHPHRDMEIFTYILDGLLTHKDSMGSSETLGRGAVQYMSAGTGVRHSEMNHGDEMLRFLQIWIRPNRKGIPPNYGSRSFRKDDRHNKLHHVVTSYGRVGSQKDTGSGVIPIHQDANIFVSECDPGVQIQFPLEAQRQAYMVCMEGSLKVNDQLKMEARDAIEVRGHDHEKFNLEVKAGEGPGAHFMVIEMPKE
ncbi:hypothetical protein CBR_g31644 [Chara braunii]|nr:hypothetical protein CBR_g31644 [Chara braunii]|eukprot:GBG81087.1 hypothetical protein CBR_g31644 [Chara braunii]